MAETHIPFDTQDPFERLADEARKLIAEAGIEILALPEIRLTESDPAKTIAFLMAGVMTGACGIALAQMEEDDEAHRHILEWIIEITPDMLDQARSIYGLPALSGATQ